MRKTLDQFEKIVDDIRNLKELSVEKLNEPIKEEKWSIIQIVGHLYYWDKYNLEKMVPFMREGVDLPPFPDHDQHNEEAMTFLEGLSVELIIESFVETRRKLIDDISRVGKDARFTIAGGKRKFSAESFLKIFIHHDEHHLKQIKEKLSSL